MNLLKIKIKYYLSYEHEEIDFRDKDHLFMMIGRNSETADETEGNGSGKSALVSAVPCCLYGRSRGVFDKELNNEDIVYIDANNERKNKCELEVLFSIDNHEYQVNRTITPKGAQTLTLYGRIIGEEEFSDLTLKAGINKRTGKRESGIIRTQQRIADILGCDVDLFINSVFFEQSNIDTFARGSLGEKDNIFRGAIGIDRWNDYGNQISLDIKKTDTRLNNINAIIEDTGKLEDIEKVIAEYNKDLVEFTKEKTTTVNSNNKVIEIIDNITKQITVQEEKAKASVALQIRLTTQKQRLDGLYMGETKMRQDIELRKSNIEKAKQELVNYEHNLNTVKAEHQVMSKQIINKTEEDFTISNNLITAKKVLIGTLEHEMASVISRGKAIPTMTCPLGIACDKLTPEEKEKYRNTLLTEYAEIELKIESANQELDKLEKDHLLISEALMAQKAIMLLEKDIQNYTTLIKTKGQDISLHKKSLSQGEDNYAQFIKDLHAQEAEVKRIEDECSKSTKIDLTALTLELEIQKSERKRLETTIKRLDAIISDLSNNIAQNKAKITKATELNQEFNVLQSERELYKHCSDMVKKNIPHLMIKNMIPELEEYAKNFIYRLSNGRMDIEFALDKELKTKEEGSNLTNAFDIWVYVDGKKLKYALTSGGQRARADVAIHLAYVCFMANKSKGRFETIWLDEVGAALDKKGIEDFVEIIKELKERFGFKKIFLITQNPELKRMIDNVILIVLTGEGSKAYFQ